MLQKSNFADMITESIHNTQLFSGIDITDVERAVGAISYRTRKYKSGSVIALSGEEVKELMIVISGKVKGEMVDFAGKVIKIEDIPAPGALASAFIFGKANSYPVNVIAVTDSEIMVISKPEFLKLLRSDDRILVNFLDMISNRSQFLSDKIKFLNFRTIRSKLAGYILNLSGGVKQSVILDRTQSDLADYFGVTRPSIGRAMGEMEEEGLISAKGKAITILDLHGLKRSVSD